MPTTRPKSSIGLLIDLEAPEDVVDAPIIYASRARAKPPGRIEEFEAATHVTALLDTIVASVPPPKVDRAVPLQMAVSQIDWDDYLGRITVGKITRGTLEAGQSSSSPRPTAGRSAPR